MKYLGELKTQKRADSPQIRALYPEGVKTFPGKMKTSLAREIIRLYFPTMEERTKIIVLDPMAGAGTTCVASILEGCLKFVGCDKMEEYVVMAQEARYNACKYYIETEPFAPRNRMESHESRSVILPGRSEDQNFQPYLEGRNVQLAILSPPFPKSHSQGESEAQENFQDEKGTFAGNDFEDMEEWDTEERFVPSLVAVLSSWVKYLPEGAIIAIHIKNHIEEGEVRVDLWVKKALEEYPELRVEGYYSAPLDYRSMFQELQRYHLRKIKSVKQVGDKWEAELECGHFKKRDRDPGDGWKHARCVECGVKEGHKEITEERLVVARKVSK